MVGVVIRVGWDMPRGGSVGTAEVVVSLVQAPTALTGGSRGGGGGGDPDIGPVDVAINGGVSSVGQGRSLYI